MVTPVARWSTRRRVISAVVAVVLVSAVIDGLDGAEDVSTPPDETAAGEEPDRLRNDGEPEAKPTISPAPTTEPSATDGQPTRTTPPRTSASNRTASTPAPTTRRTAPSTTPSAPTPSRPTRQPRPVERYAVLRVVDGDTVEVAYHGGRSVRVIGIDTPETVHPTEPVECGGPAASALAHRMLDGKDVQLVFDPSQGRTDAYGRTLAYIEAPGVGDFGLAMVRRGAATEYTYDEPYRRQGRYVAAHDAAQAADRGLWGTCGGPDQPLTTPAPSPTPTIPPPITQPPPGSSGGNCAPGYQPCVPTYPPDLDCGDMDGPITVTGDDPHALDAEGDGLGCE